MSNKNNGYKYGLLHENETANFLKNNGYEILQLRYKSKYGEIDIVAKKLDLIIFVEVKSRNKNEMIEVILRKSQIKRIKNCALDFISNHIQYQDYNFRFDFALYFEGKEMEYHKDYF